MTDKRDYFKGIDGLRAVGVICVLIAHFWPRPGTMLDYFHFGRAGVILFFVISGFLIASGLLILRQSVEEKKISSFQAIKIFYYRRSLRIFPIYYLALVFFYLIVQYPVIREHIYWHVFYLSNYGPWFDHQFGNAGHFWTLAVEEQFYLLIPILIISINIKKSLRILGAILIIGLVVKFITAYWLGMLEAQYLWNKVNHPLWGCLEGLCLGSFLAYMKLNNQMLKNHVLTKVTLISFFLLIVTNVYRYFMLDNINQDVIYASLAHISFAISSFVLLSHVLIYQSGRLVSFLEFPMLRWIGKISYGIYLYHFLAKPFISDWIAPYQNLLPTMMQSYSLFITGTFFSLLLASLSFILIEKPILKLKRLYDPVKYQTSFSSAPTGAI
jgi:peptidoglycan/LPS O-acetylase OafA/YrhL